MVQYVQYLHLTDERTVRSYLKHGMERGRENV